MVKQNIASNSPKRDSKDAVAAIVKDESQVQASPPNYTAVPMNAAAPGQVDYPVHFEESYVVNGGGSFSNESYYPNDPSNSMDGSYTDYASYCPPPAPPAPVSHPHSEYMYSNYTPDTSGYYSTETYNSTAVEMVPYDCYHQSNGQQHTLEKYQAAFVDALEGGNSSMDMDSSDPLLLNPSIQQPVVLEPHQEFHYEYETNYGNNEWTMNYVYPETSGCNPPQRPQQENPNYCLTTCVFSAPQEVKESNNYYYDIRIDNYSDAVVHPAL